MLRKLLNIIRQSMLDLEMKQSASIMSCLAFSPRPRCLSNTELYHPHLPETHSMPFPTLLLLPRSPSLPFFSFIIPVMDWMSSSCWGLQCTTVSQITSVSLIHLVITFLLLSLIKYLKSINSRQFSVLRMDRKDEKESDLMTEELTI